MSLPNEPKINAELETAGASTVSPTVPTSNFEFIPTDDWWSTPNTPEFDESLDPEYAKMLNSYKPIIDSYAPSSLANMNTPYPENSTGQYNPRLQQLPADISTPEGTLRNLENQIANPQLVDLGPEKPFIADPIYSSKKAVNFERYYEHPKFAELGFHPYANNEEYYNANSDIYDDMSRMWGQFGNLVGSGFTSVYRSYGDLFDSDPYFTAPDLNTASEFEDAMAIGMSSRDGFGGFANNLLLNSGYTVGIISSIAAEELLLAGATALSGGALAPAAGARTAWNIGRLGKAITNSFAVTRMAKATRNMLKTMNQVDNARNMWKATKAGEWGLVGRLFAPETMAAVKGLKTAKNGAQNLTNMAKASKFFGGFYRDARAVNLAIAESKLEAGMVYNQQIANGIFIEQSKTGNQNISTEQMESISENAEKAAFHTVVRNAPLIYFSNQLVLGNALGGFNKSLARIMNDKISGLGRRIIQGTKTIGADGTIAKNVFKDAGTGLKGYFNRLKAAGVKGSAKMAAGASLRYFSANFAEGIQEISQEAISKGTKDYYSALQMDPTAGGIDLYQGAVTSAVDSQFSAQGFETFMSGFLMGGIVQGPQKLYFQALPYMYQRVTDPKGMAEVKQKREKFIKSLVDTHNKAWNKQAQDPSALFDPQKMNFMVQKEVANEMKKNLFDQDQFGFMDAKDFGKFHQFHTIFQNGTAGLFRSQLQDFLNLNDKELAEAFPASKSEIKSGKLRQRVEKMLTQIDTYEDRYNRNKDKYTNPFDRSKFKEGTREYNDEALKEIAFEHARFLQMFTEDGFNRALERANSIYTELAADPILSKLEAKDLTLLLDNDSLSKEIQTLMTEAAVLEDTDQNKDKKKQLVDKAKRLAAISKILNDPKNVKKDGTFDRRKIGLIRNEFEKYVQFLADTKDGFVDKGRIDDVLKKIVDYKALKGRARTYDKAIQYLADPTRLDQIVERQYAINKELFKKNKTDLEARIKKYLNKIEANELLNQLDKLGVYPDADQAEMFLKTGDARYLQVFFNEKGVVDPKMDKELYGQIREKIGLYNESMDISDTEDVQEDPQAAQTKATETKQSEDKIDTVLDEAEVNAPESKTFGTSNQQNPSIKNLLNKLYRKHKRDQQALGKKAKSQAAFLNSSEAVLAVKAYEALKKYWYDKGGLKEKYKSQKELMEAYNTDEGFTSWLVNEETNPDIKDILEAGGLTFNDFYSVEQAEDVIDTLNEGEYGGKPIGKPRAGFIVIEYTTVDKDSGEITTYWQLKTTDNKDVSEELLASAELTANGIYSKKGAAVKALNTLAEKVPTSKEFAFDKDVNGNDIMLSYGTEVEDAEGNKFIVTSSPASLDKYGNLSLIPIDKVNTKGKERKSATKVLKPGEFGGIYKITDTLDFSTMPSDVSRLQVGEATRSFPHQNGNRSESREEAQRRYDIIMTDLTPQERATIELIISLNPNAGVIGENYKYESKESNPYIKRKGSKYIIGLKIGDPKVAKRINKKLKQAGLKPTDSADGIFAYVPNDDIAIFNKQNEQIDPRTIDKETAQNTFDARFQANALSKIRNNFTIQANFLEFIDKKLGNKQSMNLKLSEFLGTGFGFTYNDGTFTNKDAPKSLTELDYYNADDKGSIVILDNRTFQRKDENGKTKVIRKEDFKTNIEDAEEETKLIEEVKAGLEAQGLLDLARNMGAYVAIIKNPMGVYTLAELKASEMTPAAVKETFKKLVDRAVKTRQENLSDPENTTQAKRKDLSYNLDWNKDFKSEVFISTISGYNIQLRVDPAGRIEANIINKDTGKPIILHTKGKLKGKPNPIVISQEGVAKIAESESYSEVAELFDLLNETEVAKELGIKITTKSMRESFPIDVPVTSSDKSVRSLVDLTTTNLDGRVRYNIKLSLTQSSDSIQASENAANTESKKTEQEKQNTKTLQDLLDGQQEAEDASQGSGTQGTFTPTEDFTDAEGNPIPKGPEMTTSSSDPQIDLELKKNQLKDQIKIRKAQITDELKAKKQLKNLKKALKEDAELKKLNTELNNIIANKVISPELSITDVTSIDEFESWAIANLPAYITVEDIRTLANNQKAGGVRVGAFVLGLNSLAGGLNVKGTIYTGASSPYKYHEAFHGVFRMLLTDQEITKYLGLARREVRAKLRAEGKNFKEELNKFRNSADTYQDMSEARLIEEYYEEYLADEFEKFKKSPKDTNTSSEVKSLFTRILEWIKSVLGVYSKNELTELFKNIDSGKYKSAQPVENRFTQAALQGLTIEANALVPFEKVEVAGKVGFQYLDADNANAMVRSMAAIYIQREEANTDANKTRTELLDEVLEDFKKLYDVGNPANENQTTERLLLMNDYSEALESYPEEIRNSVSKFLNLVDINLEDRIFAAEQKEDTQGLRGVDDWDTDASLIGGFSSLSAKIRRYIMTTTLNQQDIFGNTELTPGEKLIVPVDFAEVYNGMLKAVKNTTDPTKILKQLYVFGQTNPQTGAVVNRIFNDIGITQDKIDNNQWTEGVQNPLFFNALIKGMENFRVDYVFIHRNRNGRVLTYSAANRDDANSQIDKWGQAYSYLYHNKLKIDKTLRDEAVSVLNLLQSSVSSNKPLGKKGKDNLYNEDENGNNIFTRLSKNISRTVGITISPTFIKYSILQRVKPENLSADEKLLLDSYEGTLSLDSEKISNLKAAIKNNVYVFSTSDLGMQGVLKELSMSNAPFDETIGASVFKNANGDLVYAHQKPTFHLKRMAALNNPELLEDLKTKDDDFLINNWLLNNDAFISMASTGMIGVTRISGGKTGNIDITEDGVDESRSTGTTYGDFTPKDFIANLVNSYTYLFKNNTGRMDQTIITEDPVTGELVETALAPVLIRVIEASNTGDMAKLPIIKAVENKKGEIVLTDQALDVFKNQIKAEFERIKRETNPDTATERKVVDYNSGANRNVKFTKTGYILREAKQTDTFTKTVRAKTSEVQVNRIKDGDQNAFVYNTKNAKEIIQFTADNEVRNVLLQQYDKATNNFEGPIKSLGKTKINSENRDRIISLLGAAVSNEKTNSHTNPVRIGEAQYWVESGDMRQFLKGTKEMFLYEVVRTEDNATEDTDGAPEVINNYESYLQSKIKEAYENGEEISFEDAIGDKAAFDNFLRNRLEQEYLNFRRKLDSVSSESDLSTYIRNGLQNQNGSITPEVRKSNRLLNLTDDINHNLRQIFFNNWINSSELNKVLLGDVAMTLKNPTDEVKRAKAQNAAYDSVASIIKAEEYGINHPLQKMNLFAFEEPQVDNTFNDGKTDNADAQLWMTTKAFRYMWFGLGKLSAKQADLLNRIEKGEDIAYEELVGNADQTNQSYAKASEMINSKKLVYADGRTFVKMSAFVLTPEYTSTKESGFTQPKENKVRLHNLRVKMEEFEKGKETIALAAPVSALKMLKENVNSLSQLDNTDAFKESESMVLDPNFMGLQTVSPSNKLIVTDPTQVKTLVTSEQNDKTEVILNGEPTTIGQIRKSYNKAISNRVTLKYLNRRNSLFNFDINYANELLKDSIAEGEIKPDLYVYLKYAQSSLEASNATSNTLEMFSLDETGQQKYNLNNPQTVKKFEQLFLSFFSKGVLSEKTTGMTFTLVSDYGVRIYRKVLSVDENGMPDKHEVIREDVWEKMANKPEIVANIDQGGYEEGSDKNLAGLAGLVENAGSEGVVIIDRLRSDMKAYNAKGEYQKEKYTESIMPVHHASVGNEIKDTDKTMPDVISKMFGVRIPSQDNHSTVNIKMVDFMPTYYGSSAVFARELIEISGADFDIDKLYVQSKDFYEEEGEFFEYGKAKTEDGKYSDYIRAINKSVKKPGNGINEALLKYKNSGAEITVDFDQGSDAGFSENAMKALSALGLPITFEQYTEYKEKVKHEPYIEAISNDIINYKYALMGNEHVANKDIGYQPAVTDPLEDLLEDLAEEIPYFKQMLDNEDIDVDSPLGQLLSFEANKAGAKSIGAVVLPNLYLNLLQEYDISLEQIKAGKQRTTVQLELGGKEYNDFSETRDSDANYRTQYVLSALITAMTDNGKLRLSGKLGLNKDALSTVAAMTALGVPIKTSILLINHPTLRKLYYQATNKEDQFDAGIATLVKERLALLERQFGDTLMEVEVNDELLIAAIDANSTANSIAIDTMTEEQAIKEYSTLKQFQTAHDIKDYIGKLSSIMNLTNGLGASVTDIVSKKQDMTDLGIGLSKKAYEVYKEKRIAAKKPIIDVRSMFKDTWQGQYIKIFNEIESKILPKVFLTQTPLFKDLYSKIITNMNSRNLTDEIKENIRIDLLGYLTIKAYDKKLLDNDPTKAGSLSNALIYPQLEGEKITDVIERLRSIDNNNFFLDSFVVLEDSNQEGNSSGIEKANANTFNRISDSQKVNLQSSFAKLYGNLETRDDAIKVIHYMMVKDGFRYGYQSLLDAVTPFTYDTYLEQVNSVESALRQGSDVFFNTTFGMNYSDLVEDFLKGYLTSSSNRRNLRRSYNVATYNPTPTKIEIQSTPYKPHTVNLNENTLYVFGDNASALGKDGNRSVRDNGNSFGVIYKKGLADIESNYYTNEELDAFVLNFEAQLDALENLMTQYESVKFPKYLVPRAELKALEKNSPEVFKYIKDSLNTRFGYNIADGKRAINKASKNANKQVAYIDETSETSKLIINTYPGQKMVESSEFLSERKPSNSKSNNAERTLNRKNLSTTFEKSGDRSYLQVLVPYVIKIDVGTQDQPRYRYFQLSKAQSVNPQPITATNLISANYAEYVEVDVMGSDSQNPIGFMFGERPTMVEVRTYVRNMTGQDNTDDYGDVGDKVNFDQETTTDAQKIAQGAPVEYDGKNTKVGEVPESEIIDREVTEDDIQNDNQAIAALLGNTLGSTNQTTNPTLTEYWDNNIQQDSKKKGILAENDINSLEDFIQAYEDGTYESEDAFLDKMKECYNI